MRLPVKQISERQWGAAVMLIEPATEIVQGDGRSQMRPQARQGMGPLLGQRKGHQELVMHRLDDLAQPRERAPQDARPGDGKGLVAFGRAEHHRAVVVALVRPPPFALEVGIGQVVAASQRPSDFAQPGLWTGTGSQQGLGQALIGGRGGRTAVASDDPIGVTTVSRCSPSYQPTRLLQPRSACPTSHPSPRRLALRVTRAVLSRTS